MCHTVTYIAGKCRNKGRLHYISTVNQQPLLTNSLVHRNHVAFLCHLNDEENTQSCFYTCKHWHYVRNSLEIKTDANQKDGVGQETIMTAVLELLFKTKEKNKSNRFVTQTAGKY